jgi:hypothetical protein
MNPNILLRRLLLLDAVTCLVTGLLLTLAASGLATLLVLPASLLVEADIVLLAFALFVFWAARQAGRSALPVEVVIALNFAWAVASVVLVAGPWIEPNALGTGFVAAQAGAVALLAGLQLVTLRRMQIQH